MLSDRTLLFNLHLLKALDLLKQFRGNPGYLVFIKQISSSEIGGRDFQGMQGFRGTPVENHWHKASTRKGQPKT
jgi:hypothetical protein